MTDRDSQVWVFFYGTFMSAEILAEHGVVPAEVRSARLAGFALSVQPRVNLERAEGASAYGALARVTPAELESLYAGLERDFGIRYQPEEVTAETLDGRPCPALCYRSATMPPGPADPGYVRQLAACVRALGLPEGYALHVESFLEEDHG